MTMIDEFDQKCSVCGETSSQPVLLSTNSFGYPDLDLRPSEMQRSTMNTWVHECPHCGYVGNLEEKPQISEDFLKSEEYITCEGHEFKGMLSKLFYKKYLIAKNANDTVQCFLSLRNCAWDCDDYDDENATDIRKMTIPYLDELIRKDDEDKNSLLLIRCDFLRRCGEFEKVISEYENLTVGEEPLDSIIRFQLERAAEKDTGCYTVEDVVGK